MMNILSNREHRCLNDLSPKDRHLFLINDLNELLRDTILDYLIMYNHNEKFDNDLREFMKCLTIIFEKVYKEESDVLKNKDDKDCWLLTALSMNEIAREAFNDYITHTH